MTIILTFLRAFWPYILVALLAAGIVGGFALHERHIQSAKDAKALAVVQKKLDAANVRAAEADSRAADYSRSLTKMQAMLAVEETKRLQQAQEAAKAVAAATLARQRSDANLAGWRSRYAHAPASCRVVVDPSKCGAALEGL